MNLFKTILRRIQRWARRKSLQAATREANKICLATGKTMLIYFYMGEFRYIAKQDVKRSGVSGAKAEAIANAIIVRSMKKKEDKPNVPTSHPIAPKMTPAIVKDLREQTIKKFDKIVKK